MKRFFVIATVALCSLLAVSCEEPGLELETIFRITAEEGKVLPDEVVTVKLIGKNTNGDVTEVLASTTINDDKSFEIVLGVIPTSKLFNVTDEFDSSYYLVSNENAKMIRMYFELYDENDVAIGKLHCGTEYTDNDGNIVSRHYLDYIYCNTLCSISNQPRQIGGGIFANIRLGQGGNNVYKSIMHTEQFGTHVIISSTFQQGLEWQYIQYK